MDYICTSNAGEKGLLSLRLRSASAFSKSASGDCWVLTGPLFVFSLSTLEGDPHILEDGEIWKKDTRQLHAIQNRPTRKRNACTCMMIDCQHSFVRHCIALVETITFSTFRPGCSKVR